MNFFDFVIASVFVTLRILSSSSVVSSSNSSSTVSSSTHRTSLQHRLTVVENDTFFQIQSSERLYICIEVFKSLEQVGRLWLQKCKSKSESGIERQMFGVSDGGILHPSTKPLSCIFLYNNKHLKYRKNCASIKHKEKNQFVYNFFDQTFFLMGDVTNVMTVLELQEKKQVILQKGSSRKITKQRWNLHFERDRVLQPGKKITHFMKCLQGYLTIGYQRCGFPTTAGLYSYIDNLRNIQRPETCDASGYYSGHLVPLEDIDKHNKKDDYWVVIDGYVVDITEFLAVHPMGAQNIIEEWLFKQFLYHKTDTEQVFREACQKFDSLVDEEGGCHCPVEFEFRERRRFSCIIVGKVPSAGSEPPARAPYTPTKPPMPSDKHPLSPTSTQRPAKELPARPPLYTNPVPTTYHRISTSKDFNLYVYSWLKYNMEGEHVTDPEKKLYRELVEKYG